MASHTKYVKEWRKRKRMVSAEEGMFMSLTFVRKREFFGVFSYCSRGRREDQAFLVDILIIASCVCIG